MHKSDFITCFTPALDDASQAFKQLRQKSWDRFLQLGPLESRYAPLGQMRFQKADKSLPMKLEAHECSLVFVNGWFCPELSKTALLPKGACVSTLTQAMKTFSALLVASHAKSSKEDTDSFSLLNAAVHQEGAFLYLPPKTELKVPLHIISIIDLPDANAWVMPRLHLVVGASAEVTLVHRTLCLNGSSYLYNAAVEIQAEENAHVHSSFEDLGAPSNDQWMFESLRVSLKSNATFSGCLLTNSHRSRRDWKVALAGSGAEANMSGVWLLDGKKEASVKVSVDHLVPHCRSMQLFKGVLTDAARSSFEGKILVRQHAIKTEAYQLNNNLMLSDQAEAQTMPNLEIYADDVKASHGATVGQLDKEQLFYLKTRGMSDVWARNSLIHGFCEQVTKHLREPAQISRFRKQLATYLQK